MYRTDHAVEERVLELRRVWLLLSRDFKLGSYFGWDSRTERADGLFQPPIARLSPILLRTTVGWSAARRYHYLFAFALIFTTEWS